MAKGSTKKAAAFALLRLSYEASAAALPQVKAAVIPAISPSFGATRVVGNALFTASVGGAIAPSLIQPTPVLAPPRTPGLPAGVQHVPVAAVPLPNTLPRPPVPIAAPVVTSTPRIGIPSSGLPPLPAAPAVVDGGVPAVNKLPVLLNPPAVPIPRLSSPVAGLPSLANPNVGLPAVPATPDAGSVASGLSQGILGGLGGLGLPTNGLPAIPNLPSGSIVPSFDQVDVQNKLSALGSAVLAAISALSQKGTGLLPGLSSLPGLPGVSSLGVSSLPSVPRIPSVPSASILSSLPVASVPGISNLGNIVPPTRRDTKRKTDVDAVEVKRQLPSLPAVSAPAVSAPALPVGGSSSPLGAIPIVGGSGTASPLNTVTGLTGGVTGGSSPLGAVTSATSSLPLIGGGSSPLGAVTGATGSLPLVGGGSSSLGAVTGALAPVTSAVGSLPVAGNLLPNISPYVPTNGIPGSDPLGGFGISIVATLLSLLKKDPMSLFSASLPIPALVKRDVPHLEERLPEFHIQEISDEMVKRQVPGLPSLSGGIPGVGIGSLPLSGIPGVSPDLAYLVGSIAKNIAVPGGSGGLGSVTGQIMGVLNGVIPNFVFKLPAVQDSVATFGVLQLLSNINPTKFKDLAGLNSLPAVQQAASQLPAADLAFLKTLPVSSDPSNAITTITSLSDSILSLPGNVSNLKAATAALSLRNLGLSVPGLA